MRGGGCIKHVALRLPAAAVAATAVTVVVVGGGGAARRWQLLVNYFMSVETFIAMVTLKKCCVMLC